jgi:tetratricopeptide (TPR) repeat protein
MNLTGKRVNFRKAKPQSNPYRVLVLLFLLLISVFVFRAVDQHEIVSPFDPTPIPTRMPSSYAMEGETHFIAGDLNKAIAAYQNAIQFEPQNYQLWSELARIRAYSSASMTTDAEQHQRLQEALDAATKATDIAPDDSTAHAIRAFVLDWLANPALVGDQVESYITQAEQEAVQALQLDNQNTLALTYYAEILVDQQKWLQAQQYAEQAIASDPSIMDVHRVYGYVLETLGDYLGAIDAYGKAVEIMPNLTYLYIQIGLNYRILAQKDTVLHSRFYDAALENFEKASTINEQLGINDPIPYIAIGKTYSQLGEFFIASLNMRHAVQINPTNPDSYGQLGIVYFKARNYEGSIEALKCAVNGCTPEESCAIRQCDPEIDQSIAIQGMPLTNTTVVYYYTYGSVLAAMHRPTEDKCTEAVAVLEEVKSQYANDATVLNIVNTSEEICASFGILP